MSNYNKIGKRLWEAADQLRANSGLKYSQFSKPILGLIFLRYADYKFNQAQKIFDKENKLKLKKGTMDDYIPRRKKISPADYQAKGVIFLPENAQYAYILDLPEGENIGKALNEAMKAIEKGNDDLKGVLDIDYNEIPNSVLIVLMRLLSKIDFEYNDDIFGRIYEFFLGKFAMGEGQRGGEYFTPETIVKLIVEILEPNEGRIFDPACGSGGMFVQSANYIKKQGKNPMELISVFGQEKSLDTVKLCKMNLAVHGISGDIKKGNTYYEDHHNSFNKFDFVMTNPPFNVSGVNKEEISKDRRYIIGIPRADNANFLWIQIFLSSLNDNGKAGFVMHYSALDIAGSEREIRKAIIEMGVVDEIISIGPKFFQNVGLSCSLWFFDKSKMTSERKNEVLFINARSIYHEIDRSTREFLPEQIEFLHNIIRLYRNQNLDFIEGSEELTKKNFPLLKYQDVLGLCRAVSITEIQNSNYSLNPGVYIKASVEESDRSMVMLELEKLNEEIFNLNKKSIELDDKIEKKLVQLFVKLNL